MKKLLSICGCLVAAVMILQMFTPVMANAQAGNVTPPDNGAVQVTPAASSGITNPLNQSISSIPALIAAVLKFVVNLLAIAGVLYIIWTGFLFVKAQGNPEELTKARTSFMHAIIGMAIILGAWGLAVVISNTVSGVTGTSVGLTTNP